VGSGGIATSGAAGSQNVGGAIYGLGLTLRNSVVTSNTAPACNTDTGGITDGDHNVSFGDATCPGANADPLLGPLADNGGPTLTRRPTSDSPLRDAVPASGANCSSTDQRGVARPNGASCEIGAYEVAPPGAVTDDPTDVSGSGAVLHGTVTPNAPATYHFDYGATASYGSSTPDAALPGAATASQVSAAIGGLAPGTTYHVRIVAGNLDGSSTGADRTFTTSGRDTVAPVILSASVKPKKFKRRRGTTFRYKLSEAARVQFTVQRRKGKRYVRVKRLTKSSKAGANKKKLATRKFKRGRYRATLVATDAAGNRSKAKRLTFRIKR
jgi:hypothetical protein